VAEAAIHRISAFDGLTLLVREWNRDAGGIPILCLPGIVRTGADFETLAEALGDAYRIVAVDYPGRGGSGRSRAVQRYAPEACARDIMDICAALHLHRVVSIGTSFGGLLTMGLAAARPGLIAGAVLNDIGPQVGAQGNDFVRNFIGDDPALESLDACVNFLRQNLPPLSLYTDEAWRRMAELTYAPGADGKFHPLWDTRIARLLRGSVPDLWPLFGALANRPLLLVRGEVSDILMPETVLRMQSLHDDMKVVTLPAIGHAPILTEPLVLDALTGFLRRFA